jgi:hypothetical protein
MATAVMQQLAALVTGQMGQMGFAVPPHLTQQQQQQPSPHDQMPQMRLQMRIPFSAQAQRAAHAHSDAQEQAAAAVSARRLERRNIEQQVAELRRLQALHQQLQVYSETLCGHLHDRDECCLNLCSNVIS